MAFRVGRSTQTEECRRAGTRSCRWALRLKLSKKLGLSGQSPRPVLAKTSSRPEARNGGSHSRVSSIEASLHRRQHCKC